MFNVICRWICSEREVYKFFFFTTTNTFGVKLSIFFFPLFHFFIIYIFYIKIVVSWVESHVLYIWWNLPWVYSPTPPMDTGRQKSCYSNALQLFLSLSISVFSQAFHIYRYIYSRTEISILTLLSSFFLLIRCRRRF